MTRHKAIFDALAAPFQKVKTRPGGAGRQLTYITARQAMNRLDEVLGPENWEDEYYEVHGVLFCRVAITLPDGRRVAKCGSGGFKEMTEKGKVDQENTDKTGESDAFKRAVVKFGVARYLYQDGVALLTEYDDDDEPDDAEASRPPTSEPAQARRATPPPRQAAPPEPAPAPAPSGNGRGTPKTGKALYAWVKEQGEKEEVDLVKYLNGWAKLQEFPGRMLDWDADQVAAGVAEALRKIRAIQPSGEPVEEALSNGQEDEPATRADYDTQRYGDIPRGPDGLWKWMKKLEESYRGLDLIKGLEAWRKKKGFPWKKEEYSDAQHTAAVEWVMGTVDDFVGLEEGASAASRP